ncbi:MAG: hypothetical protein KGJ62_01570 [Armatimonadetes bacterium]|nr:hypothetical protein [Armatimonadota bacterium]MDE2205469.1 hypothetical protein [Armatimonadota bacterium]
MRGFWEDVLTSILTAFGALAYLLAWAIHVLLISLVASGLFFGTYRMLGSPPFDSTRLHFWEAFAICLVFYGAGSWRLLTSMNEDTLAEVLGIFRNVWVAFVTSIVIAVPAFALLLRVSPNLAALMIVAATMIYHITARMLLSEGGVRAGVTEADYRKLRRGR